MKINVLTVEKSTPPGKKYVIADVTYKDLESGKVQTKKLFSFGDQEAAYKVLVDAQAGQVFAISAKKNDKGYWDWVSATLSTGKGDPSNDRGVSGNTVKAAWQGETADERAKKQVFIVRQSSIASAVQLLTTGAKTPPSSEEVIEVAKRFTKFVFEENSPSLFDMPNDLPQDVQVD